MYFVALLVAIDDIAYKIDLSFEVLGNLETRITTKATLTTLCAVWKQAVVHPEQHSVL